MTPPNSTAEDDGPGIPAGPDGIEVHIDIGAALVRGRFRENSFHKHFACQIVVPGQVDTIVEVEDRRYRGEIVLIAPEVAHRVRGRAALLLVEPDSTPGAKLADLPTTGANPVRLGALADPLALAVQRDDIAAACTAALELLDDGLGQGSGIDPRVAQALNQLDRLIASGHWPGSIDPIAEGSGLSTSRFRHLFADEVHIPWSRYLLWRKLAEAARLAQAGHALTACAHEAGFADAAHLSRAFRATFGFTPSGTLGARQTARRV